MLLQRGLAIVDRLQRNQTGVKHDVINSLFEEPNVTVTGGHNSSLWKPGYPSELRVLVQSYSEPAGSIYINIL